MIEHGGDLDRAMTRFGGGLADWIDLSTGINRNPYPIAPLSLRAWTALPTKGDMADLCAVARRYYAASGQLAALAGAQSAIQLLPGLRPRGRMAILGPTYNEYANVFTAAGWQVDVVAHVADLAGADIAIVVNPNNPDGRVYDAEALIGLRAKVGLLVVDESFMDMTPAQSLAGQSHQEGLLILRSFGKFFGLAGLRLGFALGAEDIIRRLAQAVGPWPISGAAIEMAMRAYQDRDWATAARLELKQMAAALDQIAGWPLVGGTDLFRLYQVEDASATQEHLAAHQIWSRRFAALPHLIRLGTPAPADLPRLRTAFASAK